MVNQEIDETTLPKTHEVQLLVKALIKSREAKGWSIEEVADKLKVAAEHLAFLENEQLDIASLDPFKRGYLRNYAEILDVDISDYQAVFNEIKPTDAPLQSVSSEDPTINPVFSIATLRVITTIVIVAIIALLVVINL